jgi:hypothetical protein
MKRATLYVIATELKDAPLRGAVNYLGKRLDIYEGGRVIDTDTGMLWSRDEAAPVLRSIGNDLRESWAAVEALGNIDGPLRDKRIAAMRGRLEAPEVEDWLSGPTLGEQGRLDDRSKQRRERRATQLSESTPEV